MGARHSAADVAVVGGGPAGAAAAIACALRGLRVTLFERGASGRDSPGETLHPGIEPLLAQLGVGAGLAAVTGARHPGIWTEWGGPRKFEPFGADAGGPWRGFQVKRGEFDAMLRSRAQALGVVLRQPVAVGPPLLRDGAVCGLETDAGPVPARLVIDATGRSRWLGRALGIDSPASSPPLLARYGYVRGSCPQRDGAPLMAGDAAGWTWTALVRPDTYQWTHLALDGGKPAADWLPEELRGLLPLGRARGADVTWRLAAQPAGPGWFMVGDAAALLDPSSARGVMKALMSGMAAAHLGAAVLAGQAPAAQTALAYRDWLAAWFAADAARMGAFYRGLGAAGFA
ncbi:NAD(P)/FAD-dependent oxidoreductase [Janthinobacterium fluminis]|uniref:Tryptophan 7-halogenase n=1 Tax=Janthinobacterium fluminis TaxID=2987524 RepID=A0ABT5K511_9BURK|nr:FAD-dependent oxidoreductase [Janthinobacterium fluminis]MDC8760009.1 tryptophan 7-halogenase [Janthinobacterium fluminis]